MSLTHRLKDFSRSGTSMAVSISVANATTYAFTVLAAHVLGPQEYGALASLMAALLVVGVLPLGLQATAARRVSAEPTHLDEIERQVVRVGVWSAIALGLVMLVCAPLVVHGLKLDGPWTAIGLAAAAVPLTLMGAQAGVLQGERRWPPLSLLYLAVGVPRLVIGAILITWRPTQGAAIFGVALAAVLPIVVGWLALRARVGDVVQAPAAEAAKAHPVPEILWETFHNSQALLAFFVLSNADIIVARHVLPSREAGLYAAGLILAKAMMFLPQFVVIVAFPDMSTESGRRRALLRSLLLVAGLGVAGIGGAFLLRGLALLFVGGPAYDAITDKLWLYAVLGTVLSMLQLLVYAVLARAGRRPVILVWATVVAVVAIGSHVHTLTHLLATVLVCDTLLLAMLLAMNVRGPAPVVALDPVVDPSR